MIDSIMDRIIIDCIIDRVSDETRERIEAAVAAYGREPTDARWDDLRRLMVAAEREADDWRPGDPLDVRLTPHQFLPRA